MVKTIKAGVTHKGNVLGVGATIDGLKAEDEERLVNDGWCEFVQKEQSKNRQPENKEEEQSESEQEEQSETEQPKTEMPSSSKWL